MLEFRINPTNFMVMAKSKKRFPPKNYAQQRRHFLLEKHRIKKYFPSFRCGLRRKLLTCYGSIVPSGGCDTYKIKIVYREGGIPKVYITDPIIKPDMEYHIYKAGHLCLYDHRESP